MTDRWKIERYVDSMDSKNSYYFLAYQRSIAGKYSHLLTGGVLTVDNITFSYEQGFSFSLNESNVGGGGRVQGTGNEIIEVEIVDSEKVNTSFESILTPKLLIIPYSDELFVLLSRENEIQFKITITKDDTMKTKTNYSFICVTGGFSEAVAQMQAL
jgi:hypothetical protein